jgi:hypothetical protein
MPIDQTLRGLALEIDASTDPAPEAQPLLEYRFIDLASTQTILARIRGIPQSDGGGQLAFETNPGAAATSQRMLIDHNGNVGIGTGNPGARLDVAGDAKFSGPLSVQGALTASGPAKIGGDLSVTGKLTATSFAGDGAGLSNIAPVDGSITSIKLAEDVDSLGKVSGGKVVARGDVVGIAGGLQVSGTVRFQGPLITSDSVAIGVPNVGADAIFDVGSRMRVRQGNSASAGIWLSQRAINADAAFVGMASDNQVGFWGNRGIGWGLVMQADNGNVGVGIGTTPPGFKLDVGDRIRLRQGPRGSAGIWLFHTVPNADVAFFGMHADNLIGFYGSYGRPQGGGVGWGLTMRTDTGDVWVAGSLTARAKTFKIDHPLDPANKYLSHSSVESPDMMNIYNGNTVTDADGNAAVVLPDYFEALNGDFRYQLTVIGTLAQAAVANEIENNRFTIKTNEAHVKVSWQVTGIRQDTSAKAHPLTVEEEKPEAERGLFLHPEGYGQPESKGIAFARSPEGYKPIPGQANRHQHY